MAWWVYTPSVYSLAKKAWTVGHPHGLGGTTSDIQSSWLARVAAYTQLSVQSPYKVPQTFYHNHRPIHRIVTQRALCRPGKGLLAMDESPASCDARLAALGMEKSAANRHRWRDVLLTTPGLER